jgi:hypothetical protein
MSKLKAYSQNFNETLRYLCPFGFFRLPCGESFCFLNLRKKIFQNPITEQRQSGTGFHREAGVKIRMFSLSEVGESHGDKASRSPT